MTPIVWQARYKLSDDLSTFLEIPPSHSIVAIKAANRIRAKLIEGKISPFAIPDNFQRDSAWLASHFVPFPLNVDKLTNSMKNKKNLNHAVTYQGCHFSIEGGPFIKDDMCISCDYEIKLVNGVAYTREFIKSMVELVDSLKKEDVFVVMEYERQRYVVDQNVDVEALVAMLLEEGFEYDEEFDEIADCYIYPKFDDM